jgi:hypothetical protein
MEDLLKMTTSRQEQLQQELSRRQALQAELNLRQQPSGGQGNNEPQEQPYERTPMDAMRDVAGGIAGGAQNLASGLLESGEYLTRKGGEKLGRDLGHPVNIPKWNAREFMGLEGKNPIDLQKMIQSEHPDWLSGAIGKYLIPSLAGGANAVRQMLMQGGYGASQANPDEQNAMGLLPSGRGGAAVESAAMAGLPFAMPKMVGMAKNAINKYFSPQKTVNALLQETGGGKTIPENAKELSNRLSYGQQTAKEEALIPKREVMAESGDERIFPSQKKPQELTEKTSSIFAEHPRDVTPEKMTEYQKALKTYYKDGDIDSLVEKGEDIFNHPGLNEKQIMQLDEALIPEKPVKGEYLKIKNPDEHYSEIIQDAHDAYVKDPTFRNSDKLRSRLFKRMNELGKREKAKTITDNQEVELRSLKKSRDAIIRDQEKLIGTFSPENQGKYGQFNKTWREDVRAYEDAGTTIKNMKNGHLQNITPTKITNAFAYPELKPEMQKVLKDIGPEGVNNIIFNEIGRAKDPKKLLEVIENLERNKGFAPYITPKMRDYTKQIRSQLRNKNILKYGAGTVGTGVVGAGAYETAKNVFK